MEMLELEELFPEGTKNLDFSELDPSWEPMIWYAASDAICTWLLYEKLAPQVLTPDDGVKGQKFIYDVERLCVAATRWMERPRVLMDQEKARELIRIGQREWVSSLQEVYGSASEIVGRDIRPGYYKLMMGTIEAKESDLTSWRMTLASLKFDPDVVSPSYMELVIQARSESDKHELDPVVKEGKKVKVQTLTKRVLSMVNKGAMEEVDFPFVYDVLSPEQLGSLLRECKVPGLTATEKSGQVATNQDELERVLEEAGDKFPFATKIKRFREISKALSTYLLPIIEDCAPDGSLRAHFNAHKIDTGRFCVSATKDKDKRALDGGTRFPFHGTPATYDPKRPECLARIRECIIARPGKILCAIDYSGVELRIVSNLSYEPKWLREFFHCSGCDHMFAGGDGTCTPEAPPPYCPTCGSDKIGDLHTLTGLAIFGADAINRADWKKLRGDSKCVHPDTLVVRPEGVHTIGGVVGVGAPDTFVSSSGSVWAGETWAPIMENYYGDVKPLYHVVTTHGILTCSDNHGIKLADGSVKTLHEGLGRGDYLAVPTSMPLISDLPFEPIQIKLNECVPPCIYTPNYAMAYFAGLISGDGATRTASSMIVHGHIDKVDRLGVPYRLWQDILVGTCNDLGLKPVRRPEGVYLGSAILARFLEHLGLVFECQGVGKGKANRTLRIPPWVLKSGPKAIYRFLGGLMDTDGTVAVDGAASITTKDAIFAGQIAAVLQACGKHVVVEPSWNKTYRRWYYRVHLPTSHSYFLKQYMKHPGKIARLRKIPIGRLKVTNQIIRVIPATKGLCVDFHLGTSSHLYWANGIITHNSCNFALCYGGGGNAVVNAVGCDKNEGWRIKNEFDKTYKVLAGWWVEKHKFARKHKFVTTAFGRRLPMPDIDHAMGGIKSKAERNSVNSPVQGCLHPESRIPTSLGLLTLQELWDRQSAGEFNGFDVWTGKAWAPGRVLFSGEKLLRTTTFESGKITQTSPEHLFRVWASQGFKWVPQEDLQIGDWVATGAMPIEWGVPKYQYRSEARPQEGHLFNKGMTAHNSKSFLIDGNHPDLWEFLGMVYGDGSIGKENLIVHVGENRDYPEFSSQVYANSWVVRLNQFLNAGAIARKKVTKEGTTKKGAPYLPMWEIKVHNKEFRTFCRDVLGVLDQNTYTKRFPRAVWSESKENRAAFLRGYFSADGTVSEDTRGSLDSSIGFSVRSTNQGLLKDTQDLLGTLGIRANYTPRSLRTTVLDRWAFREQVGYNIDFKTERAMDMVLCPQSSNKYFMPPDLTSWIGGVVKASTVAYGPLASDKKSAVLRLVAGSGSKPQCLKYLDMVPEVEVPTGMQFALGYNYERVTKKSNDMGLVTMYDIEVFDDDHAFVCDGVITHNTSADITKLAMGLIYKECKKRDWLEKVHMLLTMHDELVFEIDKDILEEALDTFVPIMCRNKAILNLKWPVPLTSDVEMGMDWTVHWNLKEMRRDGVCPPELEGCFKGLVPKDKKVVSPPEAQGTTLERASSSPKTTTPQSKPPSSPPKDGPVRIYQLKSLGLSELEPLARIMAGGSPNAPARLRVLDPEGGDITGVLSTVWGGTIPNVELE